MSRSRGWRYWRNLLVFTLLTFSVGAGAGIVRLSYRGAMNYVHPPRAQLPPDETPARFGVNHQDLSLVTRDGIWLSAWSTPSRNGAVILVAHGYGSARSAELHALFARWGYGVISWDARAHGASGGERSTLGYHEALDVEAALDYALQQDGTRHVGAFGQSMGASTLIRAAAQRVEIEAVVADSAFPALEEMIDQVVPYPVVGSLVRLFAERETGLSVRAMRPVDDIGRISPRPVFLIQATGENLVPADSAHRLYAAAREPRTLWIGAGAGHVGVRDAQLEEYDRRVKAFFDASLLSE